MNSFLNRVLNWFFALEMAQQLIVAVIATAVSTAVAGLFVWLIYKDNKEKKATRKAAGELLEEIRGLRQIIESYSDNIKKISTNYVQFYNQENGIDINSNIPVLKIQMDLIKTTPKFIPNAEKIEKRSKTFTFDLNHKANYLKTYTLALMLSAMTDLLNSSKISGFIRSVKILEDYIGKKQPSKGKKKVADSFAHDYFDDSAYLAISSLTSEIMTFETHSDAFDELVENLNKIAKKGK